MFAKVTCEVKRRASGSWLSPLWRSGWARYQERQYQGALIARRRSALVGDVLYRVLLDRPANRGELAAMRRQARLGKSLLQLATELAETEQGSRRTVKSFNPAVRVWLRPQFEPGTTDFPTPRLVFLHLAKTGGTSLSDMFTRWFGPEKSRAHLFVDEVALTPDPVLANLRVIAGHLPFAGLALIPGHFLTMTVLRDPFERTVSHFYQLKHAHPLYHDVSLEQFVFNEQELYSGNYQARYLAHDADLANAWRTYSPEERIASLGGDRYQQNPLQALFEIGPLGQTDDQQLLDDATANLELINLVGTTDRLDTMTGQVTRLLGMPPEPLGHLNRTTPIDLDEIDLRIRRRIDERTAVDRHLYDRAKQRSRLAGLYE